MGKRAWCAETAAASLGASCSYLERPAYLPRNSHLPCGSGATTMTTHLPPVSLGASDVVSLEPPLKRAYGGVAVSALVAAPPAIRLATPLLAKRKANAATESAGRSAPGGSEIDHTAAVATDVTDRYRVKQARSGAPRNATAPPALYRKRKCEDAELEELGRDMDSLLDGGAELDIPIRYWDHVYWRVRPLEEVLALENSSSGGGSGGMMTD